MATPLSLDCVPTTGGFASPPFDGFAVYTWKLCTGPGRDATKNPSKACFRRHHAVAAPNLSPKGVITLTAFGVAGAAPRTDIRTMNMTETFLIAMGIIFTLPYLIWRFAKTDYVDSLRHHLLLLVMPVFFLGTGLHTNRSLGGGAVFVVAAILLLAVASTMLAVPVVCQC